MDTPNFHVLQVKNVGPTNANAAMVKITSERFNQSIKIPYSNDAGSGSPALDTAIEYFSNKGWKIIGKGMGKDHYYLITNTFQPLRNQKS